MFRNNYHPAFVMGFVSFTIGIFLLCISGIIYSETINNEYFRSNSDGDFVPAVIDTEVWLFFIGTIVTGFIFMAASIGVMKQNKIARNIIVGLCFLCLIGIITFYGIVIFEGVHRGEIFQIAIFSGIVLTLSTIVLSIIFVLTGNAVREYFGEDKIDTHEDLLDNF